MILWLIFVMLLSWHLFLQSLLLFIFGANMVKIVYNRILGGWFIVRGPHQSPIGGRYETKQAAEAALKGKK